MAKEFMGLIAAPFTPMNTRGQLNLHTVADLASSYQRNGVAGAFIAGTTGEGPSLMLDEKIALMEAWGQTSVDIDKIFMVGGTSLPEMQHLAQLAKGNNMDAVAMLAPYFFKPKNMNRLVDFFRSVAEATEGLPIYFYHIPTMSGFNLPMYDFLEKASNTIPNFAGIKYSSSDIFDFQRCTSFKDGQYSLLWGTDEALLSGLAGGADGAVGSTYNYAAPLYLKIIEHYQRGEIRQAQQYQQKAVAMVSLLLKYGGGEAGKAFMKIIGLDCGWFRQPLQPLSHSDMKQLEIELKEIGFFEFCSQI